MPDVSSHKKPAELQAEYYCLGCLDAVQSVKAAVFTRRGEADIIEATDGLCRRPVHTTDGDQVKTVALP